jgi:hypothetical protein
MKLSVLLFILLCSTLMLCPLESHAGLPLYDEASRSYRLGQWQFDAQTSYYEATANYSRSGGEYVSLPDGASYHLMDLDFGARWVPKNRWALYATSRLSNAESKNSRDTRQDSSFTQIVLGTDFLLHSSQRWDLYPDLSVTVPLQRVDPAGDTVLNGEGATEFSGKIIARMKWGMFDPFAFVGFTYRDEDRSSLLPYGLGAELQFSNWRFGGELRGFQTAMHDKYNNNPAQRDVVAIRDGYALHYFSVDPTLLETNFWLRGNLSTSWAFKLGGGTSLTGSSTSAGWNVFIGLTFSPQLSSSPAPSPIVAPYKDRSSEELQNFHEETTDGVDQNLFQKPAPPPPVNPPPRPPPPPPAAVDPAKPTSLQQKKNLQKELDQTEFQIELKSTKKKKKKKH